MAIVQSIKVSGMTCGHCVAAVTEEVGGIAGVQEVSVDLDSGMVEITSSAALHPSELSVAIEEAGYEVVA